ncbi:hypothetical protein N7495_003138 [Penicillium taxi]|uniref:uncharacterized protein n=1 Tax=Penicillium taxi TaxID=168475 RepID=UPI002544F08C|nr:uncharacterized protein N7495_003138 [Penicillium taxi]KAJ5902610.1 hypothetical protein N7495_003138 [Penicillium taxi]
MESWQEGREPCGKAFIAACVVLSVVQIMVVAARFYTRHKKRILYGLDDYLVLFALIANIAKAILYIVSKFFNLSTALEHSWLTCHSGEERT